MSSSSGLLSAGLRPGAEGAEERDVSSSDSEQSGDEAAELEVSGAIPPTALLWMNKVQRRRAYKRHELSTGLQLARRVFSYSEYYAAFRQSGVQPQNKYENARWLL